MLGGQRGCGEPAQWAEAFAGRETEASVQGHFTVEHGPGKDSDRVQGAVRVKARLGARRH